MNKILSKSLISVIIISIVLATVDQITKYLASTYLQTPYKIFSWFSLQYAENIGIAWSIQIPHEILIPLNIILLIGIIVYSYKYLDFKYWKTIIAISLIIGGAIGNIIDRVLSGYVVDFISVSIWPVFNLADSYLIIGIFLIMLFYGKIKKVKK